MSALTIETPFRLGDCGCVLETGDEGRPLFVPCLAHNAPAMCAVVMRQAGLDVRCPRPAVVGYAGRCKRHGGGAK